MKKFVKTRRINMSRKSARCPVCGGANARHSIGRRRIHEVGVHCPAVLVVTYSKHYCEQCRKRFSLPMEHLAPARSRFTNRVRRLAVDLILALGYTYDRAELRMRNKYHVRTPISTMHDWVAEDALARVSMHYQSLPRF